MSNKKCRTEKGNVTGGKWCMSIEEPRMDANVCCRSFSHSDTGALRTLLCEPANVIHTDRAARNSHRQRLHIKGDTEQTLRLESD